MLGLADDPTPLRPALAGGVEEIGEHPRWLAGTLMLTPSLLERLSNRERGRLRTEAGVQVEVDEILWVTAAGAPSWPAEAGLEVDARGFVKVGDTLQSVSHPEVFAVGDLASMVNHPRPKSGVFGVRQGKPLTRNLRRMLLGRAPRPFVPQEKFLSLITTGDKYAVASRGACSIKGRAVWLWKDWIDRRFMDKDPDVNTLLT